MIHYSCDQCHREIVPGEETRYVVKMDTYAAMEPMAESEQDDDRDHLEEIQELLANLDELDDVEAEPAHLQFDLCHECYKKFLRNPLGRDLAKTLHFSEN